MLCTQNFMGFLAARWLFITFELTVTWCALITMNCLVRPSIYNIQRYTVGINDENFIEDDSVSKKVSKSKVEKMKSYYLFKFNKIIKSFLFSTNH